MPVGMHCQKVYLYISEGKRNHKNVPRTINRKMKDLEASHSFKNCLAFSSPSFLWLAALTRKVELCSSSGYNIYPGQEALCQDRPEGFPVS